MNSNYTLKSANQLCLNLELGGTDEGTPGLRAVGGEVFYAVYFRDLDGNKLGVFSYG